MVVIGTFFNEYVDGYIRGLRRVYDKKDEVTYVQHGRLVDVSIVSDYTKIDETLIWVDSAMQLSKIRHFDVAILLMSCYDLQSKDLILNYLEWYKKENPQLEIKDYAGVLNLL